MGFEDRVEQSFGRPCGRTDGRFKRTYELTSSIVPRGTSFHHAVELEFPPLVRHCFHAAAAFRDRRRGDRIESWFAAIAHSRSWHKADIARDLGIFGSPTFVVGRELFWGDDRLEDAIRWYRHGCVRSPADIPDNPVSIDIPEPDSLGG
jgi:hypothetical protein